MASARQVSLEQLMADLGRERYWTRIHAKARGQRTTDTPSGRYLLRESVEAMSVAVHAWRGRTGRGMAHVQGNAAPLLGDLDSPVVALVALRSLLDVATGRRGMAATAYQVGTAIEEEVKFLSIRKTAPRLWQDLKRRLKARRDRRRRSKILSSALENVVLPDTGWTRRDQLLIGAALIELALQSTGLFEVVSAGPARPGRRRHQYLVCKVETLNWLETAHEENEALFPFYLPTFDLPAPWTNPYDGGYHSNLVLAKPLVKSYDRRSRQLVETADMPTVYRAVNAIQDTAWEVNPVVLEVARAIWEAGTPIAGIPERVDEGRPPRPGPGSSDEEMRAWRVSCAQRYERVLASRSKRVLHAKIMFMAEKFAGETFYFPHACDFRGRAYPVPFFLQPQGCSLARGLLRFAAPCTVRTADAFEWFLVHGANCWGFDKVSFRERMEWVRDNHPKILSVHSDPLDNRWWADADKPWEFLAWCLEYGDAGIVWRHDEWVWKAFQSQVPIAMDGSNNGLQIYSLLLRDEVGAAATNCAPSEAPRDVYQDVADRVTERLVASPDPMAADWIRFIGGRLPRAACKRQVMTLAYGSTFHACIHYTRDWYEGECKRLGSTPFERGYGPSTFLAKLIWAAMEDVIGPALRCMSWLQGIAKELAKRGEFVRWVAPSGFPVRQEYTTYKHREIKTAVGEAVRRIGYRKDTTNPDPRVHKNGVAPNLVHSLDAAVMFDSVCRAQGRGVEQFAMVHDSYATTAADAPALALSLREAYAAMFSRDLLADFRAQVQAYAPPGYTVPEPPEYGGFDVSQVLRSTYFFA